METRFRTITPREANEKRRSFERRTGLKWEWYHTGIGVVFTPIVTRETPVNDRAGDMILPYLTREGVGFVDLAKVAELPLEDVLGGAKSLVRRQLAIPVTNRCGHFAGLRLAHRC